MPFAPAFETQPPRLPEATEIPKTYAHADRLLGQRTHLRIADETWIVRDSGIVTEPAINLVWCGHTIVTFTRDSGWNRITPIPQYRAVLDILRRIYTGSRISIISTQTDTHENWTTFNGGAWHVRTHKLLDTDPPTPNPQADTTQPLTTSLLVHPAVGVVQAST